MHAGRTQIANIIEFDSKATLRPDEQAAGVARELGVEQLRRGRESGAAIGGGIASFGRPIQRMADDAERHVAGQMIGHGAAISAELTADLTKQIDDAMNGTDPNNVSVGQGLREHVEKSIQKFQSNFDNAPEKAQNWALSTADSLRQHFGQSITAHEMSRASDAAEQNMRSVVRANANSVDLDPSSLPTILARQRDDFGAYISTHTLTPEAVRSLHKQLDAADSAIAYTAAQSVAKKNPEALFKELADGAYDKWLDPQQKERLEKFARAEQTYKHEQLTWQQHQDDRAKREASETAKDKYVTAALDGKPLGDYGHDPALSPEAKENIRSFQHAVVQQAIDRSESTPHPQEWRALIDKLHDMQSNDPNNISDKPIYDALREQKLNKSEFASALSIFHSIDKPIERQIRTYVTRAEQFTLQSIEGSMMKKVDAAGYADAVNRFELEGRQKIAIAKSKGEDVTPLITPTLADGKPNKDFVFSAARFQAMLPNARAVTKTEADKVRKSEPKVIGGNEKKLPEFANEAAVKRANLPDGTKVIVNGRPAVWNN